MFCPKCGTSNPDTGKFCRKCGTDLGNISKALTGNLPSETKSKDYKKKKSGWESAIGSLSMGVAFMVVSFILGASNAGRGWWFWLLIPAFGMIGAGVSKIINIQMESKENNIQTPFESTHQLKENAKNALPPKQTEFASDIADGKYETGDLVPPSVVENTTRHLEMDPEGKTMTLPEDKV